MIPRFLRKIPSDAVNTLSEFVFPIFVVACIVFGGASRQNDLHSGILQLVSAAFLFWMAIDTELDDMPIEARPVLWFALVFVGVALVQLIPVPPSVWTQFPGREVIFSGLEVFEAPLPWLPISLAPERTLDSVLNILPPLAIFVMGVKLRWRVTLQPLLWIIPLLAVAGVLLGVVQIVSGAQSPAYLYENTNRGSPVGFFANVNHQASFLVMSLTFVAALAGHLRQRHHMGDGELEKVAIALTVGIGCLAGVMVAGSIAGYLLVGLVLLSAYPIVRGSGAAPGKWTVVAVALFIIGFAVFMAASPFVLKAGTSLEAGPLSRVTIFSNTIEALRQQAWVGSGLGAFEQVYPFYESPNGVGPGYVNHAHNDYLEFVFELGIPGILLLTAFLAWLAMRMVHAWTARGAEDSRMRKAASVALGVVMLHSLVDYPLRTISLSTLGAVCLVALTAVRRRSAPKALPAAEVVARNVTI